MLLRCGAILALGGFLVEPQASDDWKSAKEWWGQITYRVTRSGEESTVDTRTEWKEDERLYFEGPLDFRTNALTLAHPSHYAPMDAIDTTRFQAWMVDPRLPTPTWTASVSGDGRRRFESKGMGEAGSILTQTTTTTTTRSGHLTKGMVVTLQVDLKKGTFALQATAPAALRSPEVKTHERVVRTSESFPRGGSSSDTKEIWTTNPIVEATPEPGGALETDISTNVWVFEGKLPKKVATLKGTTPVPMRGKGRASGSLEWEFRPAAPPDIRLEIEAKGDSSPTWDAWRPVGGPDERTPGSFVLLTARTVGAGVATDKPRFFKIRLQESSREQGLCINFPEKPDPLAPDDFAFRQEDNPDQLWNERSVWTVDPKGNEFSAKLACFDYGAWGEVTAEASLESGRVLTATVKGSPAERALRLPSRAAKSKIARSWNSPGADDEDGDDDPPGDGQKGDGLTNYEEYRGFMENGKWKEGDPKKKDFFVRNQSGGVAEPGIALFESITRLAVHRLAPGELSDRKVVNFSRSEGPHKVDQHGILIVYTPAIGMFAQALTADGDPGLPKDVILLQIGAIPKSIIDADLGGGAKKQMLYITPSVAHELLHCCNVYHHGEGLDSVFWTKNLQTGAITEGGIGIKPYDEAGQFIASQLGFDASGRRLVNLHSWQGVSSGDTACVMRYDDANCYIRQGRPSTDRVLIKVPPSLPEAIGAGLCTSPAATGTNLVPGRFGPCAAGRGNCAGQIVVNDAAVRTKR